MNNPALTNAFVAFPVSDRDVRSDREARLLFQQARAAEKNAYSAIKTTIDLSPIRDTLEDLSFLFNKAVVEHYELYQNEIDAICKDHVRKSLTRRTSAKNAKGVARNAAKITKIDTFERECAEGLRRLREMATHDIGKGFNPLGIYLDVDQALTRFEIDASSDEIAVTSVISNIQRNKILHPNQIRSMVDILFNMLIHRSQPGIVVGAVQGGKTSLALSMIFLLAPIYYRLTGVRVLPLFISTNQHSHVTQTGTDLSRLIEIYGDVRVMVTGTGESESVTEYWGNLSELVINRFDDQRSTLALAGKADAASVASYQAAPTFKNYCAFILKRKYQDVITDCIFIRTPGAALKNIQSKMRAADNDGVAIWAIADEPQYGAANANEDKLELDEDGRPIGKTMLHRILEGFETAVKNTGWHRFIGFSATPFGMDTIKNLWVVFARQAPNYVGINCYNGRLIDPEVALKTPTFVSFEELGVADGDLIPDLCCFGTRSNKFLRENRLDQSTARHRAAAALRAVVSKDLGKDMSLAWVGRFSTNNDHTDEFLIESGLMETEQVIPFYRSNGGLDVEGVMDKLCSPEGLEIPDIRDPGKKKKMIVVHRDPTKRILFVVTGKARLGDVFPYSLKSPNHVSFRLFFDMTRKPSDINAAIQGLPARASGVGKQETKVVLTEGYASMIRNYIKTLGKDIGPKAPRHTIAKSPRPRGRSQKILRLGMGVSGEHPQVKAFLKDVTDQIVRVRYPEPIAGLQGVYKAKKGAKRTVPLLSLARKHGILDLITDQESQQRLFPQFQPMEVVLPGQSHVHKRPKEAAKLIKRGMLPAVANKVSDITLQWPFDYKPVLVNGVAAMAVRDIPLTTKLTRTTRSGKVVTEDVPVVAPDGNAVFVSKEFPVQEPVDFDNVAVTLRYVPLEDQDDSFLAEDRAAIDSRDARLQTQQGMDWLPTFNIQITLRKVDPVTGKNITGPGCKEAVGIMEADMVYFPLEQETEYAFDMEHDEGLTTVASHILDAANPDEDRDERDAIVLERKTAYLSRKEKADRKRALKAAGAA